LLSNIIKKLIFNKFSGIFTLVTILTLFGIKFDTALLVKLSTIYNKMHKKIANIKKMYLLMLKLGLLNI